MTSPDKPFRLRGGETEQSSLHNRIEAIDRMEWLLKEEYDREFSFRSAEPNWLYLWDLHMYQQFYYRFSQVPPIDEDFCQRGAKIANEMLSNPVDTEESLVDIKKRVDRAFKESMAIPRMFETQPKKESVLCKLMNYLSKNSKLSKNQEHTDSALGK